MASEAGGRYAALYDEAERLDEEARLRALPVFSAVVREYTANLIQFRQSQRVINKLIASEARFRVIGHLLYLYSDRERFGPQGGATYGRLRALCEEHGQVSPRVLKTVLTLLGVTGFVDARPDPHDRRRKFYRPTARMLAFVRARLAPTVTLLDLLQPQARRGELLRDDPSFVERFLVSGGRDQIEGRHPADRMSEFMAFFATREGAAAVTPSIALADIDGVAAPSRAQLARRFGLSKTQVSNVIDEGVRRGFLTLDAQAGPAPTPKLRESYAQWISIELAFFARHMQPACAPT